MKKQSPTIGIVNWLVNQKMTLRWVKLLTNNVSMGIDEKEQQR
ncbi:hypothetical protein N9L54_02970 [Porticoccaceae bacterium]|jgi:hypothetical protein|nr:hypothetical protein [Porticoccaceae bacterium]